MIWDPIATANILMSLSTFLASIITHAISASDIPRGLVNIIFVGIAAGTFVLIIIVKRLMLLRKN